MQTKLIVAFGALAVVVAGAIAFKLATGECPLQACCHACCDDDATDEPAPAH